MGGLFACLCVGEGVESSSFCPPLVAYTSFKGHRKSPQQKSSKGRGPLEAGPCQASVVLAQGDREQGPKKSFRV